MEDRFFFFKLASVFLDQNVSCILVDLTEKQVPKCLSTQVCIMCTSCFKRNLEEIFPH